MYTQWLCIIHYTLNIIHWTLGAKIFYSDLVSGDLVKSTQERRQERPTPISTDLLEYSRRFCLQIVLQKTLEEKRCQKCRSMSSSHSVGHKRDILPFLHYMTIHLPSDFPHFDSVFLITFPIFAHNFPKIFLISHNFPHFSSNLPQFVSLFFISIGPRYTWRTIYGSESLKLTHSIFLKLYPSWLWLMKIPTQY